MKNCHIILLLLVAVLFSCSRTFHFHKPSPGESCRIFFSSLAAGDYTTAKKYGTEHTVKVIGFVENLSSFSGGGKVVLNDDKDSLKYCLIQGKTATCVYL